MKRNVMLLFLLLACLGFAQEPPSNFGAVGVGFQSTATPQASGWMSVCHSVGTFDLFGSKVPNYLCAANDYDGTTATPRLDYMPALFNRGSIAAGAKLGAGLALTGDGAGGANVGKALDLGGWTAVKLPAALKLPGVRAVFSVSWLKQDVTAVVGEQRGVAILQELSKRACFRFGFGKEW